MQSAKKPSELEKGKGPRRSVARRVGPALAGGGAILLAALPAFLGLGALRDPTESLHGMLGSALWTTLGPHFVLMSFVALGLAFYCRRRGPVGLALPALILACVAGVGSVWITGRIIAATVEAGGRIHPVQAFFLRPMKADGPDEVVTVATVNGRALQAAIYRPRSTEAGAPVILYIHGGGFMTGETTETDVDLRWFADQGWLVVSADYRVFSEGAPTWDLAPADVACAAAWLAEQAPRLGGGHPAPGHSGGLGRGQPRNQPRLRGCPRRQPHRMRKCAHSGCRRCPIPGGRSAGHLRRWLPRAGL